ncbi:MAG TPA: 2OG-Fe(II) oxygenase [Caulobacteraceae bacterium]|jgi:prolyl 4-hydroxylase|nr:2OG-Fe(II) oxygenase [Caulobacteraceae bacterium]
MTATVLSAQPGVYRVPNPNLELFVRRRYLTPAACAALVGQIDQKRRPSTIADSIGDDAFRTSETCDLDGADPVVAAVNAAICGLTGLDSAHGEPMQGQRYAVGQEFKAHTDYFEPAGADFQRYCAVAGQRTWTVMIYLNEPEDGGGTLFRDVNLMIRPETGSLVAWNNLDAAGRPNPWTIHHGMKVLAGTKYIVTKWFRERPWG